jgi:hypothetical protein
MKKRVIIFVSLVLALGFAFSGFSRVQAISPHPPIPIPVIVTQPDPYAVPSNDTSKMTGEVLGQAVLPGTVQLSSGKLSPLGFIEGFVQYGGPGLQVSGLVKPTTATICFPFSGYNHGWVGKIYQWDGSAWVSKVTSFPKDGDGVVNWACTKGAGNGIYSLLIWYTGPAEPVYRPVSEEQACLNQQGIWTGTSCFF